VIRVPEPEMIGGHSHLEMFHETNIKSVQREPSQTEKGATMPKCASPGEITSTIRLMPVRVAEEPATTIVRVGSRFRFRLTRS